MKDEQEFVVKFGATFRPIFLKGFGAFISALTIYAFYIEYRTGTGLSLMYTLLPLCTIAAIIWAVISIPITLMILRHKNRNTPE